MPLILMQTDGEYTLVRRRGRFDVERRILGTPRFWQEVSAAQETMIRDLGRKGVIWVGPDWEISEPMPHVDFSDVAEPDPGPQLMPDPRDLAAMRQWEAAERERVARKTRKNDELVDFWIVSAFKVKKPQYLRVVGGSPVWPRG